MNKLEQDKTEIERLLKACDNMISACIISRIKLKEIKAREGLCNENRTNK